MSEDQSFPDLIRRVRAGDEQAATELVRLYEPAIRRAVRFRLMDARLGRHFDSMDICQSVLASFFVRAAVGQYELNTPGQLVQLLVTMARNKLANQANKQRTKRRALDREKAASAHKEAVASASTPSAQVAAKELLQETLKRLGTEERRILSLREQGCDWNEIAAELGGNADALRKRYTRAVDRVAKQLGVDDLPN